MEVHINTGEFTFVPDGSTVVTATGHFAAVEVGAGGKNGVEGCLANAVGYTTDGIKVSSHVMFHVTDNGLGVTVVDFNKVVCP